MILDKYLHFIDKFNRPTPHIYLAITLLGELKFRGSSKKLIHLIEAMRDSQSKKKIKEFEFYYRATIEALTKIGTRESLDWLADEFLREGVDIINQFILYLALASQKNSYKYVGFKIIEKTREDQLKDGVTKILFSLRGKNYRMHIKMKL